MSTTVRWALLMLSVSLLVPAAAAQQKKKAEPDPPPSKAELAAFEARAESLRVAGMSLRTSLDPDSREAQQRLADVSVIEQAVARMLRFREFPKADYKKQLDGVIASGLARAAWSEADYRTWTRSSGTTVRGYRSDVDGSFQPYAVTLPEGFDAAMPGRWPLHVVLHGRADQMNEVNFIHRMDGKPLTPDPNLRSQTWIQLDVYGRGNNAYRWAGETDVFEAMADVKRRFRIDDNRVTLHGFSMGGAGAWHLGLHHPDEWSSVGPGAGFVDFYRYQKKNPDDPTQRLPEVQHQTLAIYDSVNYAFNAFNVPVCTYGGEIDPQLLASTTMSDAAAALDVPITVIVGPQMGHKFDPVSQRTFMEFHVDKAQAGRPAFGQRKQIRFVTHTLRYNSCDWLTIEEVERVYEPTVVEADVTDDGDVLITTDNVRALRLVRDIGTNALIDGQEFPLRDAADGLLPDVWFVKADGQWDQLSYDESRSFDDNPQRHKRHGLQGPIDDAFMSSFVCVRGTGQPQHPAAHDWASRTLEVFEREFAQWMRGNVRIIDDSELTDDHIRASNLVLFGDPGSNAMLARVLPNLPVTWTHDRIQVAGQSWSASDHGLCLIFPNPLNPAKYVVVNSGHTFHEKDFRSSNAWLFPRLGDIAVMKLSAGAEPSVVWSGSFDADWNLRD